MSLYCEINIYFSNKEKVDLSRPIDEVLCNMFLAHRTEVDLYIVFVFHSKFNKPSYSIIQVTSLIIKRQTISNMESDMDRWIQDRDRLSKQLEKCQMKYDNVTVLQKVNTVLCLSDLV